MHDFPGRLIPQSRLMRSQTYGSWIWNQILKVLDSNPLARSLSAKCASTINITKQVVESGLQHLLWGAAMRQSTTKFLHWWGWQLALARRLHPSMSLPETKTLTFCKEGKVVIPMQRSESILMLGYLYSKEFLAGVWDLLVRCCEIKSKNLNIQDKQQARYCNECRHFGLSTWVSVNVLNYLLCEQYCRPLELSICIWPYRHVAVRVLFLHRRVSNQTVRIEWGANLNGNGASNSVWAQWCKRGTMVQQKDLVAMAMTKGREGDAFEWSQGENECVGLEFCTQWSDSLHLWMT